MTNLRLGTLEQSSSEKKNSHSNYSDSFKLHSSNLRSKVSDCVLNNQKFGNYKSMDIR